jgi:hypothetical protein
MLAKHNLAWKHHPMSDRKADDAEVQRIVHWIISPAQEVTLIEQTKKWSEADFLYAIDRLETDQPEERRQHLRGLYRALRKERQEHDARNASEEASARRFDDLSRRLDELKKPHWSIVPNFWITVTILILTAIGAIATVLALRH